ncbi:hypothetical protein [Sphingobacterium sp. UDSM-2020]|uniref:hypothetical protein n=1 Tax=Sphingobacterium sp. UDSM-2020 TaxID=2795738 RepID=UPI001936E9DC|nr:hypothetical protein [Sphingobacterium sp. UDSM-2020]QQD14260.1 hypothetical protein JAZ75_01555 [Sphingobacterium sp. UDSM-2020]
MNWFQLKANGDPTEPSDYSSTSSPSCAGTGKICAVNANPDANNHPELTEALKDEMLQSIQSGVARPNVRLRSTS